MLKFTKDQKRKIDAARLAFLNSEARYAGVDPLAFAAMEEAEACRLLGNSDLIQGNAAPVGLDAWRRVDDRATMVLRDRLAVFSRLAAANTTPVAIGDLVSMFPKVSDSGEVHVSMDGRSEGLADQAVLSYEGTPIPIIDSFARFGWRQMEVIRKSGRMLDADTIANHQRKVADKLEDMALNGLSSIVVGGSTIYGLRNHPQRNTGTHGLTLASSTGAQWVTAIVQICTLLQADNAFGKVTIFLNYSDWFYTTHTEFAAGYPKTIMQKLQEIEQVAEFVPGSKVTANNIIGVADLATGEWGTILSAMPMVTRPKVRVNQEDDYVFSVMAAAAPQFRQDAAARMYLAHTTTA